MSKNWWGFEMPESWIKLQEIASRITLPTERLGLIGKEYAWQNDISGAAAALKTVQPYLETISAANNIKGALAGVSKMQAILEKVGMIDFSGIIASTEHLIPNISKYASYDWSWIPSALEENDVEYDAEDIEEIVTPEVKEELEESVKSVFSLTQIEQTAYSKYIRWKERHPILAWLFTKGVKDVIVGIISTVVATLILGKINKPTNVYEEPTISSAIVIKIEENGDVMIVDSVPYYYQVYYMDPETGEEKWGYIPKKNVCLEPIETSDESN